MVVGPFMADMLSHHTRETVWVISVDAKSRVTGVDIISEGEAHGATIHTRDLVRAVVGRSRTRAFHLLHNHPSGEVTPSESDVRTTEHLRSVMRDIAPLVDHFIVGGGNGWLRWHSFHDDRTYVKASALAVA
jgi:DNA repair protein RadC